MYPTEVAIVSFEVAANEGSVIATGSSSSDHIPPSSTKRQMFLGEIRVGVKPKENAEELWLYASAHGLKKAVLRIPFISGNITSEYYMKSSETGGHIAN